MGSYNDSKEISGASGVLGNVFHEAGMEDTIEFLIDEKGVITDLEREPTALTLSGNEIRYGDGRYVYAVVKEGIIYRKGKDTMRRIEGNFILYEPSRSQWPVIPIKPTRKREADQTYALESITQDITRENITQM